MFLKKLVVFIVQQIRKYLWVLDKIGRNDGQIWPNSEEITGKFGPIRKKHRVKNSLNYFKTIWC
jgi:hypothetical protein